MYGLEPEFFELPAMVSGSTVPEEVPFYSGGVDSFDGIYDFEGIEGIVYSDVDQTPRGGGGDQLTVSYCGEVYVFDNVTTEKMQKVFLHLGGCYPPTGQQGAVSYQNHKDFDYPGRCSDPRRAASLNRFREKRKDRCFEKKIRYNVRQKVASRLNRKKGKFVISPNPINSAPPNVVQPDHALPDETTLELSDNMSSLYDHFEI